MYGGTTIQFTGNIPTTHMHNVYSKLNYIFMFRNDLFGLKSCEIGPCTVSDHNLIFANICLNRKNRSTLWRLNSNILNCPNIRDTLKKEIEMYLDHNDNNEVSPAILWDALKAVIRGKIISFFSHLKKNQSPSMQVPAFRRKVVRFTAPTLFNSE